MQDVVISLNQFLTTPLNPTIYDSIVVLILMAFIYKGWKKGAIKGVIGVICIAGAYWLGKPMGLFIQRFLPLDNVPLLLHELIAISIGGVLAYILLKIFFHLASKMPFLDREEWKKSFGTINRILGSFIGFIFSLVIILIFSIFIVIVGKMSSFLPERSVEEQGVATTILMLPTNMAIAHSENYMLSNFGVLLSFLNPLNEESPISIGNIETENPTFEAIQESIDTVNEIIENPEKLQELVDPGAMQKIMEQEALQKLSQNAEIRDLAEKGDIIGLMNHPDVQEAMNDPLVREALGDIDVSSFNFTTGDKWKSLNTLAPTQPSGDQ
ncbi:CvpA family protein [Candidatus Peribacteria bacterium]|jgi:uncharacterized membrane protein required for colicin V production|nr:CvpA family protein [Candidatus Peribacteria bacterium]MBT4021629.1 CvpA family protein [Candidatus Peribacteria bacterium]MBT4240725.1 CvpA family protein [Candidatus Peribacteria bacterium]MBT4474000.1 CvpA family protein [Candidatus Peribacteria bacterium]